MPLKPYPVIHIRPEWGLGNEEMGTKSKFWYREPSQDAKWLFKYPQANTGQHWAEKIAAEFAHLIDIPHARVELAIYGGDRGSVTKSFVRRRQEMIHGNQLLTDAVAGYNPERRFHQSSHTIENIWTALEHVCKDSAAKREAKMRIAEYLVLDALIGNTDRHHENWGMLRERDGERWRHAVAPSFDHASSLGRELRDERRSLLLNENRIGTYVERGPGGIFRSEEARRGPSPLQLVRYAAVSYADWFRPALRKTGKLGRTAVQEVVQRVPDGWMSDSAKEFAVELMTYSGDELRKIADE